MAQVLAPAPCYGGPQAIESCIASYHPAVIHGIRLCEPIAKEDCSILRGIYSSLAWCATTCKSTL